MRKYMIILLVAFVFVGCQRLAAPTESGTDISGTAYSKHIAPTSTPSTSEPASEFPTIPGIDTFSSTELELEKLYGSKILSATLRHNDNEINISVDDPRLIRLVNLLLYSEEQNLSWMLQGAILDDEIQKCLATGAPTLDILLQLGSEPSGFLGNGTRVVICKDQFMIINDRSLIHEGLVAEEFYPFLGLFSRSQTENYHECDWGQEDWIDLLEIAGFVDANDIPLK